MLRNRDFDKNGHLIGSPQAEITHNEVAYFITAYINKHILLNGLEHRLNAVPQSPLVNNKPTSPVPDVVVYDSSSGKKEPILLVEVCRSKMFASEVSDVYAVFEHYKTLKEGFVYDYQHPRWNRTMRIKDRERIQEDTGYSTLLGLDLALTPMRLVF